MVAGGGYAGVMAARAAVTRSARVTLVDANGRHGFLPRLATVAAGGGPPEDADAPLEGLVHGAEVVRARVVAVDADRQRLTLDTGGGLDYDGLVLATGAQARLPDIPGLADHAHPLRTPSDAKALRGMIPRAAALVVVGAGATGTQLAAEVACAHPGVAVTLADMAPRILPGLPRAMAHRAKKVLTSRGVEVITDTALREVGPDGATFSDGHAVEGLVVWAGGVVSTASGLLPDAPAIDGQLVVDRMTRVAEHGPIFAAGDIAAHRGSAGLLPQTAQVAVQAGKLAGTNAARVAQGQRPRSGSIRHIGWVLPLGDGQAVAQVGPVVLADPATSRLAPLLHDVIDVRHLFTLGGLPATVRHHQDFISLP